VCCVVCAVCGVVCSEESWRDVTADAQLTFGQFWGPTLDPVSALRLATSWPFFPEVCGGDELCRDVT
jgi:hypothetical protein